MARVLVGILLLLLPSAVIAADPIKVGAILMLTGDFAMQGQAFQRGIEIGVKEINDSGGINGSPLEVIYEDSKFTTGGSHKAAKKLLGVDKVSAALITTHHEATTAGPVFNKAEVPLISLWDSSPELEEMGDHVFGIGTWLPSSGERVATYAYNKLSARKGALIYFNDDWSIGVTKAFKAVFSELGGTIVYEGTVNPGEADFRPLILRAKSAGADVLYSPIGLNVPAYFKQLQASGFTGSVFESDNLSEEVIETDPKLFEGVYQTQSADPDSPESERLAKLYQEKYGEKPTMLLFNAWGYDGITLLAKALGEKAVTDALYQVKDHPGASGKISISPAGSSRNTVSVFQVTGGKLSLIER